VTAALLLQGAFALQAEERPYREEIERWRQQREERLKADGGWLSVAGLFWLEQGANTFGSDRANAIVLPSGPPRAGVFELSGGRVHVRLEPKVEAAVDGKPVTEKDLRPDSAGSPEVMTLGRLSLHVIVRGGRYGIRMKDPESKMRREFAGLSWFPVKEEMRVAARLVPDASAPKISIPNVLGQVEEMESPGKVVFSLGGRELSLSPVLESADAKELFFIFKDLTAGKETYPGGRFLYASLPKDGTVVLDFNKAYSPPCAFTAYATCPLPPKQNRLDTRIEAGEKFSGHH